MEIMPGKVLACSSIALVLLGVAPRLPSAEDAFGSPEFKWSTDLEAARKTAAAEGKPLLIVFR